MNSKLLSFLSLILISIKSAAAVMLEYNDDNGKPNFKIDVGEIKKDSSKVQSVESGQNKNTSASDVYNNLIKKGKIKKTHVSNASETGSKTITGTGG